MRVSATSGQFRSFSKVSQGPQVYIGLLRVEPESLSKRLGQFVASRRRHTRFDCDWSSDVCSSDLATEPMIVRDILYARNCADFVCVGNGHKVHQANPVDDHQPIGAGDFDAAIEGAPYDGQEREEDERDREGANGQNQADLFAEEVGENEPAESHAASDRKSTRLNSSHSQ